MIDQQRWNTYLGTNFKDRTLHLCEQNAEAFFVTMKFIVEHAVLTEKQKGNQIPTMDRNKVTFDSESIYIYIHIYISIYIWLSNHIYIFIYIYMYI